MKYRAQYIVVYLYIFSVALVQARIQRCDYCPGRALTHQEIVADVVSKSSIAELPLQKKEQVSHEQLLPTAQTASLSALAQNPAVLEMIPPSIDFWIVDLKYTPERGVTIIEFGHGFNSGFKVLDRTVKKGIVYSHLWKNFKSLGLPLWYVGRCPGKDNWIAWDEYTSQGNYFASGINQLEQHRIFRATVSGPAPRRRKKLFAGCKGLVIMRHAGARSPRVKNFMHRYPDFILPSITTKRYVKNKRLTDNMFDTPEMQSYRPRCGLYERRYDKDLAQRIADDLQCEWYVIKPINSGRGNGILFVEKKDLDKTLYLILEKYNNHRPVNNSYSYKTNKEMTYEYWKHDRNSHFLVEEYVPSKPIRYRGKEYDATMRVAFVLMYDRGKICIDFLDPYWKRPVKALSDEGTFREKRISKHKPNYQESLGGFVGETDKKAVYAGLKNILPHVYLNMLIDFHIKKFPGEAINKKAYYQQCSLIQRNKSRQKVIRQSARS